MNIFRSIFNVKLKVFNLKLLSFKTKRKHFDFILKIYPQVRKPVPSLLRRARSNFKSKNCVLNGQTLNRKNIPFKYKMYNKNG